MKKIIIVLFSLVLVVLSISSFIFNSKLNTLASEMGTLSSYSGVISVFEYREISEEAIGKEYEMMAENEELAELVTSLNIPVNVSEETIHDMTVSGQNTYYNIILDLGLILILEDNIVVTNEEQKLLYNDTLTILEEKYKNINIEELNYYFGTNIDPNILNSGVIAGIEKFLTNLNDQVIIYFTDNTPLSYKKIVTNSILEFSSSTYSDKITFNNSLTLEGDAYNASLLCIEEDSELQEYDESTQTGTCMNGSTVSTKPETEEDPETTEPDSYTDDSTIDDSYYYTTETPPTNTSDNADTSVDETPEVPVDTPDEPETPTEPVDPDTDGDGLLDSVDPDPSNPDIDGDGITDGSDEDPFNPPIDVDPF